MKLPIVGYVGYFRLINGFWKSLYMTKAEAESHGKKYSKTFSDGKGLWKDEFDVMAKKTVLKMLLSKFAPLSIDMQTAVKADQSVIKSADGHAIDVDYVDNTPESININETELQKQTDRIADHINAATTLESLEEVSDVVESHGLLDLYIQKKDQLSGK